MFSRQSPKEKNAAVTLNVLHILFCKCGFRILGEHVDSSSNIADAASRDLAFVDTPPLADFDFFALTDLSLAALALQ